ncbi:MAG: hypothetical protein ACFFE1_10500 [Candidatus Thorarchaeota archaeon]
MSEYPECPFCGHRLTEPVSQSIEGSIKIRCPSCEQRYEYISGTGSFPMDDDLGIRVAKGLLGPHVVDGEAASTGDISLSRALCVGGLCCCTIVVIIPVLVALLLAFLG